MARHVGPRRAAYRLGLIVWAPVPKALRNANKPGLFRRASAIQLPTMASASISTRQRGSRNPRTTMKPVTGRISPNTSP